MSHLNQVVFLWIHNLSGRFAFFDILAIFFAQWLPYLLVAAFLVFIFYWSDSSRRRFYLFAEATLAIILSRGIITTTIHFFYYHPRPFDVYGFAPLISESGSSFPSAHAAWFFALAMTLWYVNRKWGVWFFVLATLMGFARIYAGVHWPLDIVAGAIVGVGSAMLVHWFFSSTRQQLEAKAHA